MGSSRRVDASAISRVIFPERSFGRCPSKRPLPEARERYLQKVHDRRLSVCRIRRRISVVLRRASGGLTSVRRYPFFDRVVLLIHTVVRPAVDGDGSFATWRFGRVHLARGFKCARDLDAERRTVSARSACSVVVEENVVPSVHSPGWLRMNSQTLPTAGPYAEPTAVGHCQSMTFIAIKVMSSGWRSSCKWLRTSSMTNSDVPSAPVMSAR
jgi:hypothetical protein